MLDEQLPLFDHAIVSGRNTDRLAKVSEVFGIPRLSLWPYLEESPRKYFSRSCAQELIGFFKTVYSNNHALLASVLLQERRSIDAGISRLEEINSLSIHENPRLKGASGFRWFDETILPSYVRLIEGVYANLIHPIAVHLRRQRGKPVDDLKVFSSSEELKLAGLASITQTYSNTVRNSIAHQTYEFLSDDIRFIDKERGGKINTLEVSMYEFVNVFDGLLDICNAMCLVYKLVMFEIARQESNPNIVPPSIALAELRSHLEVPDWNIEYVVESRVASALQLNLYARNDCPFLWETTLNCFRTAILCESILPGYERYFVHMDCRKAKWTTGFAAFDGAKLKHARENPSHEEHTKLGEYGLALQEPGVFFVERRSYLAVERKYRSLVLAMRTTYPKMMSEIRKNLGLPELLIRPIESHASGEFLVIHTAVVLPEMSISETQTLVRIHLRLIIRDSIKAAKRRIPFASLEKILRTGYVDINLYNRDFRARALGASGLRKELIAVIKYNITGRIQTPDIMGSTLEEHGTTRIMWNAAWLEDQQPEFTDDFASILNP